MVWPGEGKTPLYARQTHGGAAAELGYENLQSEACSSFMLSSSLAAATLRARDFEQDDKRAFVDVIYARGEAGSFA